MDKCGDADDCISTSEAAEQAAKFSQDNIMNLPVPGEVEFINGGPPCQVYYFAILDGIFFAPRQANCLHFNTCNK